jgi:hypothetical protein
MPRRPYAPEDAYDLEKLAKLIGQDDPWDEDEAVAFVRRRQDTIERLRGSPESPSPMKLTAPARVREWVRKRIRSLPWRSSRSINRSNKSTSC